MQFAKSLFLTVYVGFIVLAEASAATSSCPRSIGAKFKSADREKLVESVITALKEKNESGLKKYLPCDFLVVLTESDIGGFTDPSSVVKFLIDKSTTLKWNGKAEDFKTQFNLPATGTKTAQSLIFRKDDASGWYFAGYSTSDQATITKLLKVKSLNPEPAAEQED